MGKIVVTADTDGVIVGPIDIDGDKLALTETVATETGVRVGVGARVNMSILSIGSTVTSTVAVS